MTLIKDEQGSLIHYPSKPDMFEFDADVAQVFDSMAERSIAGYRQSHELNAYITRRWVEQQCQHKNPLHVMDVGASTGGYLEALHKEFWVHPSTSIPGLKLHAIDISTPMLDKINEKLPKVRTCQQDIMTMANLQQEYDIVNISYVLQFLKPNQLLSAVKEVRSCMPQNGLLFVSQKEKIVSGFGDIFQDRYIDFRKANGYSDEEIAAKTEALKKSMFPVSNQVLREVLESCGFGKIQETSRWLQFSSFVAIAS